MLLLAAGEIPSPLGHVLDKNLIGGDHPLFEATEGMTILGSPILTLHMVTLVMAAILLVWVMRTAARAVQTGPESEGNDRYLTHGRIAQIVEVITLYLKETVLLPILGDHTNRYLPYLLTLFFFILINNLLGLIPFLHLQHLVGTFFGDPHFAIFGSTATGNLAVTTALALIAFIVIQVHASATGPPARGP